MPWIKQRGVAVLGSDGVSDVMPSNCEGNVLPGHAATLVAMGVHLLDNLALEHLAAACAKRNHWEFQFIVAPLIIERGAGSAVNPIAIFLPDRSQITVWPARRRLSAPWSGQAERSGW